jgi:5-methyltetrahydrofolate--homocysteine methyltransferase
MPVVKGGRTTYELGPEEMAAGYPPILSAGGRLIVGACCGSTPAHIARIVEEVRRHRPDGPAR